MLETDTVIVGMGIIGLSAAEALKAKTNDFICLEAEKETGNISSGGDSRIFRLTHNQIGLNLAAVQSLPLWNLWEEKYNTRFLNRIGHLSYEPKDIKQNIDILDKYNSSYKIMRSKQVKEIFPIYEPLDGKYLFTPDAAVIDSQAIIKTLTETIQENLILDCSVKTIIKDEGFFVIETSGEKIYCKKIILSAGVHNHEWAVGLGLELPASELSFHLRPIYPLKGRHSLIPTSHTHNSIGLYCLPTDNKHLAVGLGYPAGSCPVRITPEILKEKLKPLEQQINKFFPDALDLNNPAWRECQSPRLKSNTLRSDGIHFAARKGAVSVLGGNLFKFAPLIGQKLVDGLGKTYHETW